MATQYPELNPALEKFLLKQKIFFTGSAAATGRVNISPRPTTELRVMSKVQVGFLDYIGSGNETAAHVRQVPRMTIMTCAFEGAPRILRLYGTGATHQKGTESYNDLLTRFWEGSAPRNARAIVTLDVDMVQTSCGYGVPLFDYQGERDALTVWADARSDEKLVEYRKEKNSRSIDGFETGLIDPAEFR
ncbi:MAG: pyridoxamine 5'-phosphate oxidase family protein [Pseudomonadota bacterium]